MQKIEFLAFNHTDPEKLLAVLNQPELRVHLVDHPPFDAISVKQWIAEKGEVDTLPGCRVRVVAIEGEVAGWCGIQPDDAGFELAIVLSKKFWGHGISIFKTMLNWAKEFGHQEVVFHLLETRPEYRALDRLAKRKRKSQFMGRNFTTYYIALD